MIQKKPFERQKKMTKEKTLNKAGLENALKKALIKASEPEKASESRQEQASESEQAFNALLEKIKQARQDSKAIKGYVSDALKLALKDFLIHKNKNSLEKLVLFKVDYTKSGRGLALYNLYNVKPFLDDLGIKLEYNIKEEKADIYTRAGFNLSFENEQAFFNWYDSHALKDFKKPVEKATIKPATFESIKQALKIGKLSLEEIAVLKGLLK